MGWRCAAASAPTRRRNRSRWSSPLPRALKKTSAPPRRRARRDEGAARAPGGLASSRSLEEDKRAALEAGAAGYLVKPVAAEALVRMIDDALSHQSSLRSGGGRGSSGALDP